jgi:hypothetical protein
MTSQSTFSFNNGGDIFNVLGFTYSFSRGIDAAGRPGSDVFGGRITITVQSKTKNTNVLSAIVHKEAGLSGTIVVKESDGITISRQVEFSEGYIVDYTENFDNGGHGSSETFTVTANKMSVFNVSHDCEWATR